MLKLKKPASIMVRTISIFIHLCGVWIVVLASTQCLHGANVVARFTTNDEQWFLSAQASNIAKNIISHQSPLGGFPKNIDTTSKPYTGEKEKIKPTFDNGATVDELRFLARYYDATKDETARISFIKGFDYIIAAQYPNGGFPQGYPPGNSYQKHITFNDSAMVRLLEFLRETTESKVYEFLDMARREKANSAFWKGIDCILKCQIKVKGKLTVWCAQHDEVTFEPRPARTFEPTSLSGAESVGIVRLLMSIKNPSTNVIAAVRSAVEWFKHSKITGVRIIEVEDKHSPSGKNKVVVEDQTAPPIWARFYEIGSNRPIFCDRDGVKKYSLAEIGYERRNGYGWYGYWPKDLIEKEYPEWERKIRK